jgi:hypothetical protein
MDIDNKLNNYLRITDIINNAFRPKKTRIKLYNTLALPTLLYGSENWAIKARDARRIRAAGKKYMRTAGCTWTDHKPNKEIAKELNITQVLDKIQYYKRNWIQHVNRMPRNRLRRLTDTNFWLLAHPGKDPQHPLYRRLGGPQSRSGHRG